MKAKIPPDIVFFGCGILMFDIAGSTVPPRAAEKQRTAKETPMS